MQYRHNGWFNYWIVISDITVMPADFKTSKLNQATYSHRFTEKRVLNINTTMWFNSKHNLAICHLIMQNEKLKITAFLLRMHKVLHFKETGLSDENGTEVKIWLQDRFMFQ